MRCLLLGAQGQVGTALRQLSSLDWVCPDRSQADLECLDAALVEDVDLVLNAAAWTDVDGAEGQREQVHRINTDAVGVLADLCARRGVPLVHLSTAYVFDGQAGRPYRPDDRTGPINVYGATKLAGEHAVRASGCEHVIVRTCALFSATHPSFVGAIVRASTEADVVDVVADQIVGPTSARDLAHDLVHILERVVRAPMQHTTHLTAGPDVSYAALAEHIVSLTGGSTTVRPIDSSQWSSAAARPRDARLCPQDAASVFGLQRRDWRPEVSRVVQALTS